MIHYMAADMRDAQCDLSNEASCAPMTSADLMRVNCPACLAGLADAEPDGIEFTVQVKLAMTPRQMKAWAAMHGIESTREAILADL